METTETRPKRVCSPKYAVQKARKGKKLNRWEIEDLSRDPEQSFLYATKAIRGRFPEGEPAIAASKFALEYARDVVQGRWEECEPHLIENITNGYNTRRMTLDYFINVACVRNADLERFLLRNDIGRAAEYAENCVKGRWKEAEPRILEQNHLAHDYHRMVIKGSWPELERKILFQKKMQWHEDRKDMLQDYLKVTPEPGVGFEKKLQKSNRASLLLVYATRGIRGRLPPALHQKMMMFSFDPKKQGSVKKYIKFLEHRERGILRYLAGLTEEERMEVMEKVRTK
jgi:hypothetical protein